MERLNNIYDCDLHFVINPATRVITNESGKGRLIQYDHNSERFTFDIPRFVEEHDMSMCDKIEIHYINVSGSKNEQSADVYLVDDIQVNAISDNVASFSWLISANATKYAGTLNFLVRFVCLDGEKIEYAWNTGIFSGITVANGMNNGETLIAEYSDVLEVWKREIFAEFEINFDAQTAAAMQAIQQKADETLATIPEDYTAMDAAVKKNAQNISRNTKRITNLEQGIIPEPFETDDSVAYQKEVPENALPYAEITKVGGMVGKCANLIPYPYANGSSTINGVTFTVNKDGTITANGTAEYSGAEFYLFDSGVECEEGATYTLSGCPNGGSDAAYLMELRSPEVHDSGNGVTFTADTIGFAYCIIRINEGETLNNVVFKPMLNKGSSALPYESNAEGLRFAPVTEVKSVGANLANITLQDGLWIFDENRISSNESFVCTSDKIAVNPNTTYSLSGNAISDFRGNLGFFGADGAYIGSQVYVFDTFTTPENARYFAFHVDKSYVNDISGAVMLNKGSTALPYTPYVEHTLPIPTAVQALDGYGEGVNESVYNYIDWEKKQFVKRVGKVDLGTLTPTLYVVDAGNLFRFSVNQIKMSNDSRVVSNILCVGYETTSMHERKDKTLSMPIASPSVDIIDNAYTDAAAFKSAMSGVMLYYELATPEVKVTDISDLITSDNLIGVEGNGTITFENEYGYAVPSEVTYQLKGVTA